MKHTNDEPAFPVGGMTLRDYFAAKAMQGFVSCSPQLLMSIEQSFDATVSKWAYEMADAMLKEREA